jgi:hypothetical protein
VIDADSGALIRTDRTGRKLGEVAIARVAGPMPLDTPPGWPVSRPLGRPHRGGQGRAVTISASIHRPAEPYGVLSWRIDQREPQTPLLPVAWRVRTPTSGMEQMRHSATS